MNSVEGRKEEKSKEIKGKDCDLTCRVWKEENKKKVKEVKGKAIWPLGGHNDDKQLKIK